MKDSRDLSKAWQEANAGVREAEERLGAAWAAFSAGKSGPPAKALMDEVARLRRECDRRLLALLDEHGRRGKERPSC